jgi:hypothetical protein
MCNVNKSGFLAKNCLGGVPVDHRVANSFGKHCQSRQTTELNKPYIVSQHHVKAMMAKYLRVSEITSITVCRDLMFWAMYFLFVMMRIREPPISVN